MWPHPARIVFEDTSEVDVDQVLFCHSSSVISRIGRDAASRALATSDVDAAAEGLGSGVDHTPSRGRCARPSPSSATGPSARRLYRLTVSSSSLA